MLNCEETYYYGFLRIFHVLYYTIRHLKHHEADEYSKEIHNDLALGRTVRCINIADQARSVYKPKPAWVNKASFL